MPRHCEQLWRTFLDLHHSRDGMGGPIRFLDIHAYEAVTGTKLAAWELAAIKAADRKFLQREAQRMKRDA